MKKIVKFITVVFSVLILFSCKDKPTYTKIENQEKSVKSKTHKIVVEEVLDGGSYTYLNVNENGNKYWMAVMSTPAKKGDTYYYDGGVVMKDFESKVLKRTFDFITFADRIRTTEKDSSVHKPKATHTHDKSSNVEVVKIEQPKNGTSIEKLFSQKKSFSKKEIVVKGKVIKVNNGILKKNWVHISDGTQYDIYKSLTVTTLEEVKVGDVVTFKGKVILDKDFGAGYVYDLILEEGELLK